MPRTRLSNMSDYATYESAINSAAEFFTIDDLSDYFQDGMIQGMALLIDDMFGISGNSVSTQAAIKRAIKEGAPKMALRGDDGFVRDDGLSYEGVIYGFVPPDSIFGLGFHQSVKDWALNDDWIKDKQLYLNTPADVTFADVWDAILTGRDVYKLLGISDLNNFELEPVFERLAEIGEIDPDVIYDAWHVGRGDRWW